MSILRIFKGWHILFILSFLNCFSLFGMEEGDQASHGSTSKAIVAYRAPLRVEENSDHPSLASLILSDMPIKLHLLVNLPLNQGPTYEYRLLVAPFLKKIQHDHNLGKFREFLKAHGVILRAELDDRTFTKQGRIGKDDVMLVSRDGKSFFWCNGKTSCVERRSVETPENILKIFPVKLEENYKFLDLDHLDHTHLILEVAKKAEKKNSYTESKICILDIETGSVKSLVDQELPYVDFYYPYKKTPWKIFISFEKPGVVEKAQPKSSQAWKWVVYDLKQETQLVVGEFSKDPGHVTFDNNDRPLFSELRFVHGEQTVSRIIEGPKWTVKTILSFGKEMYEDRRLCNVTENGNIYFSARGEGLDRWTPIKRTQKGAFSSEIPLLPEETGDIKHPVVHTHTDGKDVIVYEVRDGGRKTLKCQTNSNAYKHVKEALEILEKEYSGEFSFVSLSEVLQDSEKGGMILSRRQSHRPLEYFIVSLSQESERPTFSIFKPQTSLNFPLENFGEVESVVIPTKEGLRMPAFVTPPNPKMVFGKKPPLFVHIHGGPHAKDKLHDLDPLSQLVASSGFLVLKINYPGSTGSGLNYEKMSDGKWDETPGFLMQAIEWMIQERDVDPDRVAVGGVSFGATMAVNMAARFPEKIKFAVACNGTYNYPKTALEDIGYDASGKHIKTIHDGENTILQLGGDPRIPEQKELLNKKSVYPHLSKIKGPILLLAGLEDNNCIPSQSIELAKALSQAQKSVRLITIERCGHSLEIVKPQKGEEKDAYSFSAWNAVGAFTMKELSRLFGTPYESVESDFSEKMGEWGIKIALSNRWQ